MKSRHIDWIEERVDAIQNEIWERQGKAARGGAYESASDLAIWEDVFAKFMEDLPTLWENAAESRWERAQERALGDSGPSLDFLHAEARSLKYDY